MKKSILYLCILCSLSSFNALFSQNSEVGIALGGTIYSGDIDIDLYNFLPQTRPMAAIFYRHHFTSRLSVRGQVSVGQFYADEKLYHTSEWRENRGYHFIAPYAEVALLPQWRIFSLSDFDFYVYSGITLTYFKVTNNYTQLNTFYANDFTTAYPTTVVSIPIGGGIQYHINETLAVSVDMGLRKTTSDFVDGVSHVAIGRITRKDYYLLGGITLSKYFGSGRKSFNMNMRRGSKNYGCPTF